MIDTKAMKLAGKREKIEMIRELARDGLIAVSLTPALVEIMCDLTLEHIEQIKAAMCRC